MLFFVCSISFAEEFLADRHVQRGIDCVDCHGTDTPEKDTFVSMDKCMDCHGSYDEVEAMTQSLGEENPHNNHVGELDCTVCHYGHSPSTLYCAKCHSGLDLKTP